MEKLLSIQKICLAPLLIIVGFAASGQNLLQNPSFDCNVLHCDPMQWADDYERYVCFWYCPTSGTSDIFSTKYPNKGCWSSMPYSGLWGYFPRIGSQVPHSGNGFAGIYTFYDASRLYYPNYREYLQTQLVSPLEPGAYYCFEVYVSLADSVGWASNNLGAYFHEQAFKDYFYNDTLSYVPQVLERKVVYDSIGWVKISGAFQATAPFHYVTIGNFFADGQTLAVKQSRQRNLNATLNDFAYYFIDDVSLTKIELPERSVIGSMEICRGSTTNITAGGNWEKIKWTTLSDTTKEVGNNKFLKVSPTVSTRYMVRRQVCNYSVLDTIEVKVLPSPDLSLGEDVTICLGASVTLDAGEGYIHYSWQDQSDNRFFTATEAGTYRVSVENEFGCTAKDEVIVSMKDKPLVELGRDTTICDGFPTLTVDAGYDQYEWSTGATERFMMPDASGKYWVKVQNECGQSIDSITIYSLDELFIPNVVTPNGDEFNRSLMIRGLREGESGDLFIYNRWGERIFRATAYNGDWPVRYDDVQSGMYYYVFKVSGCRAIQGWVQVLKD